MDLKQQAIKAAYGEHFDFLQPDENGWSEYRQTGRTTFNGKSYSENGFSKEQVEIRLNYSNPPDYKWRPTSISVIDNNGGWTRCDDEMPTKEELYMACVDGIPQHCCFRLDFIVEQRRLGLINVTHWKLLPGQVAPVY